MVPLSPTRRTEADMQDVLSELRGKSVLVVDDQPTNLLVIGGFLEKHGLEVLSAESGSEALTLLDAHMPDIVLLDIMMPGLDGYETCHAIRSRPGAQAIPVLFLSALEETENKLKGFAAGGVDFIAKPPDTAELLARISVHLQVRRLLAEVEDKKERLQEALEASNIVNVAIGVVMERHRLNRDAAFDVLRKRARSGRTKVQKVAEEVLRSVEFLNLPPYDTERPLSARRNTSRPASS